jgi:putative hemolysin
MEFMKTPIEAVRLLLGSHLHYSVRRAQGAEEVRAAQALRFAVFNLELNEGLESSFATGLDADPFDDACDHLLVEHTPTKEIVGTYRLQTGATAAANLGYYSEQEFDFAPFESMRSEMIELGRACVHRLHRNMVVLGLLWKGIADYAQEHGARYLCGCSSLTSQDPSVGAAAYTRLYRKHLAPHPWRTRPWPRFECSLDHLHPEPPSIPKLLRAYLNLGSKICGPPAIDPQFRTIDFLTTLDLESLPAVVRSRYAVQHKP